MTDVYKTKVNEDSGCVIYHRVLGPDANDDDPDLVTADDISSVAVKVFNVATGAEVASYTPSVATVLPASTATLNGVVFNFRYVLPAAALPEGKTKYRVEIKLTPQSGEAYFLRDVVIDTIPKSSS